MIDTVPPPLPPPAPSPRPQDVDEHPPTPDGTESRSAKKRKAEDELVGHQDKKTFVLRPYASPIYDKPAKLKYLFVLERSKLPLCYLDTSSATAALPQSRFYSSSIEQLESNRDDASPKVVIAKLEADKALYAVERVDAGAYAVCKLAHWVKIKDLSGEEPGKLPGRVPLRPVSSNGGGKTKVVIGEGKENSLPEKRREKAVANEGGSGLRTLSRGVLGSEKNVPTAEATMSQSIVVSSQEPADAPDDPAQTPRQVFERLVCHYMETLYLSKTSLAFFAKGPLSRARVAFTTESDEMKLHELVYFLRSLCLASSAMEKKYREKVCQIITDMPTVSLSDDELPENSPPKRKVPKRLHPTKAGMFPLEEDYVKRWWMADLSSPNRHRADETADATLRRRTGDLRTRESFLQVIIILEIMALEASPAFKAPEQKAQQSVSEPLPATSGATEDNDAVPTVETEENRSKPPKKAIDLALALDLVVDRLCIWQSIDHDAIASSMLDATSGGSVPGTTPSNMDKSNDVLRDFFSEVIVPFYMSRLPQQVASLNKKLGGHSPPSPNRRSAVKPGAAVVRKPPPTAKHAELERKPRSALHRVATDGLAHKALRSPSLARCASDSAAVPLLKRERSETPSLLSIPLAEAAGGGRHSRAGSLANFKHMSKRQIDLSAMNAASEAKLRKKKLVEEQLKSAIGTLRRPNRGAAVREFADFADTRVGAGPSKGVDRPPANKSLIGVQVTATPKKVHRFSSSTTMTPGDALARRSAPTAAAAVPSSSFVPSSAIRPAFITSPVATRRMLLDGGGPDTPSKGTFSRASCTAVQLADAAVSSSSPAPVPRRAGESQEGEAGGGSIYDALGWNDGE